MTWTTVWIMWITRLWSSQAGTRTWRVAIAAAIFILMTLFILYSSSSGSMASTSQAAYTPFRIAKNHTPKPTNLKTWATKNDYVPVYGDKVSTPALAPAIRSNQVQTHSHSFFFSRYFSHASILKVIEYFPYCLFHNSLWINWIIRSFLLSVVTFATVV